MAHFQNKYGGAHSTDAYGNVVPTDEYGNPIRHTGTTHQGGQQQQHHDLSTEYDGQGGRRNKGLKEKIMENIPGVGNKDHRNDTSSANPISHSGITNQGGQQQQRHDLSTEYDGQGGRRNKGLKEKITENIPGVGNNTSSTTHTTTHTTTAGGYGTGEQAQHAGKKGMMEKIKEKIPGQRTTTHDQHNQHY